MVRHYRKVLDSKKEIKFKNTNDRTYPRVFSASKHKDEWYLYYHSPNPLLHTDSKSLGSFKTKYDAVEELRKYMKKNP